MRVLGYGSLMNQQSLDRLLGRHAELHRVVVHGYARIFNAPFSGYAYLNLLAKSNSVIEAVSFEIEEAELQKFSEREAGSDLIELTPGLMGFVWPASATQELEVLQSYIDFCEDAANGMNVDLSIGLVRPAAILNDRKNPKYPDMGQ